MVIIKLTCSQDWLYDEGEDATKAQYVSKTEEIRSIAGPIIQRYNDKIQEEQAAARKKHEESAAAKQAEIERKKREEEEKKRRQEEEDKNKPPRIQLPPGFPTPGPR